MVQILCRVYNSGFILILFTMSLNIDSYLSQYLDNPVLDASMAIRYPKAIKNPEIVCYVCLDQNVQQGTDFSVYEEVVCHGLKCQVNGQGAVSWVCETCALEMDIRLMVAEKTKKKAKRNMVCDCVWGSPAGVTTYDGMLCHVLCLYLQADRLRIVAY